MNRVIFIGLDLAWSARNLSGGAVIVEGVLCEARADLSTDDAIVQWIGEQLQFGDAAVLAVDAPLCVPNLSGKRACERQLGAVWRKFQAGPYPSNRERFAKIGMRGEDLVRQLGERYHFIEAAPIVAPVITNGNDASEEARFICEVFPHPAHVSLFQLSSILKYKKKNGRTYESCWSELNAYVGLLKRLATYDPPLYDPRGILNMEFEGVKGRALKALEDMLDAVTCAYVAAYLWRHGASGTWMYGTLAAGHILVPRYPPESTVVTLPV